MSQSASSSSVYVSDSVTVSMDLILSVLSTLVVAESMDSVVSMGSIVPVVASVVVMDSAVSVLSTSPVRIVVSVMSAMVRRLRRI